MRARITRVDIDRRAATVSAMLRGDLRVVAEGRNGYTGLDLFDSRGCVRTLTVGTSREVGDYLSAMLETLDIVGRSA